MSQYRHLGFTLAELLVSLMILSEIATFTIPKILYSSQQGQRKAILKETIAAVSEATYLFCLSPDSSSNPNAYTYMTSKLNAVKLCPSNSQSQGCVGSSDQGFEIDEPGLIMHNGASVVGLRASNVSDETVLVDWNGSTPPNIVGDDQLILKINFTVNGAINGAARCMAAPHSGNNESKNMYKDLYSSS